MNVCCRLVATFGNNSGETAGGASHSPALGAAGRDTSPQLMSSVGWGGEIQNRADDHKADLKRSALLTLFLKISPEKLSAS